jgi:ribosomal-protein-alanine N-acetyltransferase
MLLNESPGYLFPAKGLKGEKVCLTKFHEQDINSDYLTWLSDDSMLRYSNQRFINHTKDSCLEYLSKFLNSPNLFLLISDCKNGRSIGTMTCYTLLNHETADVGIMIGATDVYGQGYGGEAFKLFVDWLIHDVRIRKVSAGCLAVNVAMIRLMEIAGLHFEGRRKKQEIVGDIFEDILYYARFRD